MRKRRLHAVGLPSRRTYLGRHLPPGPHRPTDLTRDVPRLTRAKAVVPGSRQCQIQRRRAVVLVNVRGKYTGAFVGGGTLKTTRLHSSSRSFRGAAPCDRSASAISMYERRSLSAAPSMLIADRKGTRHPPLRSNLRTTRTRRPATLSVRQSGTAIPARSASAPYQDGCSLHVRVDQNLALHGDSVLLPGGRTGPAAPAGQPHALR